MKAVLILVLTEIRFILFYVNHDYLGRFKIIRMFLYYMSLVCSELI